MTNVDPTTVIREDDPWINRYWRPAIGVMYIVICCFDFVVFPMLSAAYQAAWKLAYTPWDPLTLKSGGLFHIAIGAILTATSFGRSQEKIAAIRSGFGESGTTTTTTSYGQPVAPSTYETMTMRPRYTLKREPGG